MKADEFSRFLPRVSYSLTFIVIFIYITFKFRCKLKFRMQIIALTSPVRKIYYQETYKFWVWNLQILIDKLSGRNVLKLCFKYTRHGSP